MEEITFPALLLKFKTPYVAFKFFDIKVTWQVLIMLAGFILVLYLASKSKENYYVRFKDLLEVIPLTAITGFVGARLFYIAFRLTPYLEDPIKIFNISDGGFEVLGGLFVGAIMLRRMCKVFDLTKKDVFDYATPFFALMQAIAAFAVMYNIKDLGLPTNSAVFRIQGKVHGVMTETYAIFVYEMFLTFGLFILTRLKQKKRRFQGEIYYLYLLLYALGMFYIEDLRAEPMIFMGVNFGKSLCFLFIIEAISFLGIGWIKKANNPQRNIAE